MTRPQSMPEAVVKLQLAKPLRLLCKVNCGELHLPHYFWGVQEDKEEGRIQFIANTF